uniref:Transposase n=1 Tax=Candidatus Kentrum sp. MB TaxID=2138164 RepID=A0A451BBS1_9GAMM|nr:MAG: hypothetical protein BECKMB1821I_GA0114274_11212 [Candidatus Kentron sp. MB]VFK75724.1 MAG: hypothetical protein BECKMB1821H_GA0114242_10307 [Candidatus Kentron sp. MB]
MHSCPHSEQERGIEMAREALAKGSEVGLIAEISGLTKVEVKALA